MNKTETLARWLMQEIGDDYDAQNKLSRENKLKEAEDLLVKRYTAKEYYNAIRANPFVLHLKKIEFEDLDHLGYGDSKAWIEKVTDKVREIV